MRKELSVLCISASHEKEAKIGELSVLIDCLAQVVCELYGLVP